MASFLYQAAIFLYSIALKIAAFFNPKAKLFVDGRKNIWADLQAVFPKENVVWFHAASLGEFEQGKPIMELLKKRNPSINLLVTFFSPSGFEERKNYAEADVFYLPLDSKQNAKKFIATVQPKLAVFIRYEFWANYLDELKQQKIPTAVVAAQFRKDQFAFGSWGGFIRQRIKNLDFISVQYESAKAVLMQHNFEEPKIAICGDSRFDRVLETRKNTQEIKEIAQFKGDSPLIILGSCYADEERFAAPLFKLFPDWKFIYAPHFVDDKYVNQLISRLPGSAIKFTEFKPGKERILILNTIGKLASSYKYGDIAIIGGGFRDGIHNILEPAAFGLPLFYGPNHKSFPEGQALIDAKLGFEIDKSGKAFSRLTELIKNKDERENHQTRLIEFVEKHAGATECITAKLEKLIV